jgi:hypothetical protein
MLGAILATAATAAVAQTPAPQAVVPQAPAAQAPVPQAVAPQTPAAEAPVPPGANPAAGAPPGTAIGTGMPQPTSDQAGNIVPADTQSPIAARLPNPPVEDDAAVSAFLLAARNALAAGRSGEAQEALERAETRLLDRSVPLFQTNTPSEDPLVADVQQALRLLGTGDRLGAMGAIQQALAASPAAPPAH